MYIYIYCNYAKVYTVGFYSPDGKWNPESDWFTSEDAAKRVHYLNGGSDADSTNRRDAPTS